MKKLLKFLTKTVAILAKITAVLSIVYFWNLDQKLLSWLYRVVNNIFEHKKGDVQF